jgi:hypothetical protein
MDNYRVGSLHKFCSDDFANFLRLSVILPGNPTISLGILFCPEALAKAQATVKENLLGEAPQSQAASRIGYALGMRNWRDVFKRNIWHAYYRHFACTCTDLGIYPAIPSGT